MAEFARAGQRLWIFALLCWARSAIAVPNADLGATLPLFVIPSPGTDLTAQRFDSDVVGWNNAFSEIAVITTQIARDRGGGHYGEVMMLVYAQQQPLPKETVSLHVITHAQLAHDPVPIEDVRDFMWAVDKGFLTMWPRKPSYKQPKGAMQAQVVWYPKALGRGRCSPHYSLLLNWHGSQRLLPYRSAELEVECSLLRATDSRIYWGRADVAAALVRFDFGARPENERSARYPVFGRWAEGRPLLFEVPCWRPDKAPSPLLTLLGRLGQLRPSACLPASGPLQLEVDSSGQAAAEQVAWLLADLMPTPHITLRPSSKEAKGSPLRITLRYGALPALPTVPLPAAAGASSGPAKDATPAPSPAPTPTPTSPFLRDF